MNKKECNLRILFAGGGTGGHLFPAIALMEELMSRVDEFQSIKVLFIGTKRGIESTVLDRLGFPFRTIWIRGFQRGRSFRSIGINLLFPLRLLVSMIQSHLIIKNFDPQIAIGTGGYTSGPPLRVAHRKDIPIFIHEQNVLPGATTRLLSKYAEKVYVSFKRTNEYIENTVHYGVPIRKSLRHVSREQAIRFFDLYPELKTVFIFGGSQGAHVINSFWYSHINNFLSLNNCQFIWQTGQREYEKIKQGFGDSYLIHITPFIHEMDIAYSASDIIICRAGALSLAEMSYFGKSSILVPLPSAAGNHQEINARIMEDAGASIMVLEKEIESGKLENNLLSLLNNEEKLSEMSKNALSLSKPDSAKLIINDILSYLEEKSDKEIL
jgi:UDP-N-acetylglucosamine--N-acetylmuramyl-(pentapeptide) pyrophosphoryl-undecaprenol N-acetylglucosamine transferase